jgi:hypothetical protein
MYLNLYFNVTVYIPILQIGRSPKDTHVWLNGLVAKLAIIQLCNENIFCHPAFGETVRIQSKSKQFKIECVLQVIKDNRNFDNIEWIVVDQNHGS